MPDEAPEAPETGTPPETPAAPPEAPEGDQPTESPEDTNWQQRYEDMRPEFDRRQSILADIEGRNGPERQAQALEQYARIQLEEEAEEPEEDFDLRDPSEEIDEIKQQLAERAEAEKEVELERLEVKWLETEVGKLEEKEGVKLTDRQYEFIVNDALANRDPHDGKPDIEGSFGAWNEERKALGAAYGKSKETVVPPVGTRGEPKIDLRDKEARQKLGVEVFQHAERAQ